jgi:PPP family 3-phenylpropionic acid transporter
VHVTQRSLYLRLSLFYFAYFLMLGGYAPFFALYLKSLRFSSFEIGMLLALVPVVRSFVPALWAWAADHQGERRHLVRWTTVGATVACAGLLLGSGFWWLFVVLLVLNVFWCAALPLVEATTFGLLKGRLGDYGRIRVWGSLSFILAVLAMGPALDENGVGTLPWALLLLFGLMAGAAWLLPSDRMPPHHGEHVPIARVVRRPEVVALFAACFLMSLAHGPYNSFYSIHLVDLGYSKTALSWLWTVSVVAEVGVFLWMPRILQRVSIPGVIAFSLGCAVVRFLAIGWAAQYAAVAAAAQLLHAATFGAHHAAALAAIHHFFQGRHAARGQALYTGVGFGAGGAAGAFLSGWMWDHIGPGLTFTFGAATALVALAIVVVRLRMPRIAQAVA